MDSEGDITREDAVCTPVVLVKGKSSVWDLRGKKSRSISGRRIKLLMTMLSISFLSSKFSSSPLYPLDRTSLVARFDK